MNRLNEYESRPISEYLSEEPSLEKYVWNYTKAQSNFKNLALLIFTLERVNMSSAEKKENNMIFGDVMAVPIECSLKYH